MNLYIYSYNNYYNRLVKKAGDNLDDYSQWLHYGPVTGVYGFTPGDGVNTVQVIGTNAQMYDGKGDYLIAQNQQTNEIDSRWFIIDTNRTRDGQWQLTLHRDLVVDYYNTIINSPMFIEKATLDADSPLIFNSENMMVNQIKSAETLLKDQSGCAWLVGYYASDASGINGTVKQNLLTDIPYVDISYDFDEWPLRKYTNKPLPGQTTEFFYGNPTNGSYYINAKWSRSTRVAYSFNKSIFNKSDVTYSTRTNESVGKGLEFQGADTTNIINGLNSAYNGKIDSLNSQLSAYVDIHTENEVKDLLALDGKLIRTNDGKFFECNVEETKDVSTGKVNPSQGSGLYISLKDIAVEAGMLITGNGPTSNNFEIEIKRSRFRILLVEQTNLELSYFIPDSNKLITSDAPWNIFAIPYSDELIIKGAGEDFTTNMQVAIDTAMSIAKQHGSKVYDIQLLPYCPVSSLITDDNEITVENTQQYSLISIEEGNYGIIFNVPTARFNTALTSYAFPQASSNIERKLNNECDKWRLTSPNYSNYFDFSVEKNNGIQSFDVDCEYKPFTPYIHINPVFGGLYGYDDNSPRGLVLGGDFSLSRISDKWVEYEIQNKNYQLTFDRQIQNMEVQHEVGRLLDITSGIVGTMTGAGSGAATGALVGGPIGAAIGGIAGGLASGIGGIADYQLNEKLRAEALDYTKDMYGYQLGNIQALPNTISKVSAFNRNNKIFPVFEYYTCTDEEKIAIANKIAWNGMSVGVISTISNYIKNNWSYTTPNNQIIKSEGYIKGKLIRLDFIDLSIIEPHEQGVHSEDYHVVNAISGELNKGMFFKTGDL